MTRWIAIGFAGLLFSSSASAQIVAIPGADGGVLGLLLGENGVVPSLLVTLTTLDFGPTIDAVAGPEGTSGLVRGGAGVALNQTLTGALDPLLLTDLPQTVDGVQLLVTGLVDGLLAALTGEGAVGIPIIGGLLGGEGGLLGGLLGGEGGIPIIGGLLGGEGGIPIIGGLLGGEGGIPIIGGLLGGEGGIPIIGGLLGGEGGIPIIGGLLGEDGGLLLIGDLLGGEGGLLGGLPILGGLLGGGLLPGGGQGLALNAIPLPLNAVDPATLTALVNGVTLAGL